MKLTAEEQIKILSNLIDLQVERIIFNGSQYNVHFVEKKVLTANVNYPPSVMFLAALSHDKLRGIRSGLRALLSFLDSSQVISILFLLVNERKITIKVETKNGDRQFTLHRTPELISTPYNKEEFQNISDTKITNQPPGRSLSPLTSSAFRRRAGLILERLQVGDIKGLLELPPMMVVMGLTDFCNHRCPFCFREKDPFYEKTKGDIFTNDNLTNLFLNLSEGNVQAIRLCGEGEDTIHPQYVKFILMARVAGINLMQITNGSTLEKLAPLMVRCIDFLRISINGWNEEQYKKKHGLPSSNTFFKVLNGLKTVNREKELLPNRDVTVCLSTVLTDEDCLNYDPEDFRQIFTTSEADIAILKLENECSRKTGDGSVRLKVHEDKFLDKSGSSLNLYQISSLPVVVNNNNRQDAFKKLLNECKAIVPQAFGSQTGNTAHIRDWITELNLGCILRYIRVELERLQLYNCSVLHDFYGDLRMMNIDDAWRSQARVSGIKNDIQRPRVICPTCGWEDLFSVMNYFFDKEISLHPRYMKLTEKNPLWNS